MENSINFYEVVTKCGHVGRSYYIPITFGVSAENGKEAAAAARDIGRVKHDHKDAILSVKQIDEDRYWEIIEENNNDPYITCKSKHDQKRILDSIMYRFVKDPHNEKPKYDKAERRAIVKYKLKRNEIRERLAWYD